MPKSMFPHLEALKGFKLSRNGLIGPGKGKKGPWLFRKQVMDAALVDVAPLLTEIKTLQLREKELLENHSETIALAKYWNRHHDHKQVKDVLNNAAHALTLAAKKRDHGKSTKL